MAENSKIEWTHHTANLWHGCTKVHAGCDHCYAETLSHRWGRDIWGNDKPRLVIDSVWNDLAKYQKLAKVAGEMHRVFVGSMMDIFEKPMPLVNNKGEAIIVDTGYLRDLLFSRIDKGEFPNLLFLLLTKRPSNINKMVPKSWLTNPPSNVMFGTSPVDQETSNKLIPQLLSVNGKRFLSIEPLLGAVDLTNLKHKICHKNELVQPLFGNTQSIDCLKGEMVHGQIGYNSPKVDWVICGGESGHGARPMHPDWARSLRDQCKAATVPFFFNQWGEYLPVGNYPEIGDVSNIESARLEHGFWFDKCGKKAAGRFLDGKIYDDFPP